MKSSVEGLPRIPSAVDRGDDSAPRAPAHSLSLPSIVAASSSTGVHMSQAKLVVPEAGHIVQSSSSAEDAADEVPPEWKQKQLLSDLLQRSKVGWENEIARHILSLYATTTVRKNFKEGHSLLDFVGEPGREAASSSSSSSKHYHHEITTNVPDFRRPADPKPTQIPPPSADGEDAHDGEDGDEEQEIAPTEPSTKQKPKKKTKRARKQRTENSQHANGTTHVAQQHQQQAVEKSQLISEILSKIDNYANLSTEKDLYRITNTIRTRDGQEIVVRGSPRCFPIWFTSTGNVYANWTRLPGKRHLQAHLSTLYEHQFYKEYIQILEVVIVELHRLHVHGKQEFSLTSFGLSSRVHSFTSSTEKPRQKNKKSGSTDNERPSLSHDRKLPPQQWIHGVLQDHLSPDLQAELNHYIPLEHQLSQFATTDDVDFNPDASLPHSSSLSLEEIVGLYEQLILTTLAIAILCIEKKKMELALFFLQTAERLCANPEILSLARVRKYYKGYVMDAMAYYFYRRKKLLAAKEYSERAMEVFERYQDYEGVGACLIHIAAIHSGLSQFKDAHRVLYQFLAMVESGRLSTSHASPKQLCMVSVAYHNLAVVQLKLNCSDLACKNSQNARKIARLCLSFSNRYIDTFQYTHQVAISDMKYDLRTRTSEEYTKEQLVVIKELSEALFAVDADVIRQPGEEEAEEKMKSGLTL